MPQAVITMGGSGDHDAAKRVSTLREIRISVTYVISSCLILLLSLGCAFACSCHTDTFEPVPTPDVSGRDEGVHDAGVPLDAAASSTLQLAVSADMLGRTLSIVDVDLLTEGGTRADALVGTVDLTAYSPGPMSLAITPDGRTALVSISSGFLPLVGAPVSAGDDKLLIVDLASRVVTAELEIGSGPMGIAVTPDSAHAFVGLFGETYFAYVDISNGTFRPVDTGASFNEELAIDDSGEVAVLSYGAAGNVRTFPVSDPMTLGLTSAIAGEAAGVAFFPGTKFAYLVQAPTPLNGSVGGHNLLDVTDPRVPISSEEARVIGAPSMYPVTAVHARGSIAFPSTSGGTLSVVEVRLERGSAVVEQRIAVGPGGLLAYGIGETRDGRVLVADPGTGSVSVVDLATGGAFSVPWEGEAYGPTEIKIIP